MTSTTMIIEHKISCVWLRSRDAALLLISGLLWGTLIATLPSAEFTRVSPNAYVAIVLTIIATCLAWSQISKLYFRFYAQLEDRRHDAVVRTDAIAAHFGVELARLLAMQQEKNVVIHHSVGGQIATIAGNSLVPSNLQAVDSSHAPFSQAA